MKITFNGQAVDNSILPPLTEIFKKYPEFKIYHAPFTFLYNGDEVEVQNTFVQVSGTRSGDKKVFAVLDTSPINKGSFGSIYAVIHTLRYNKYTLTDGSEETHHKTSYYQYFPDNMICKLQFQYFDMVRYEHKSSTQFPHLKTHRRLIHQIKATNEGILDIYALLLKRQPGVDLYEFICAEDEELRVHNLSAIQLARLSCRIIEAVIKQVHHFGYVHRDLKNENIMVEYDKNIDDFNINIIDFAFVAQQGKRPSFGHGTKELMPNELLDKKGRMIRNPIADYSHDVFSLAVVFKVLWSDL
jgi:serine/threonine protein kinase